MKRLSLLVGYDRGGERRVTIVDVGESAPTPPIPDARKAWIPVTVQALTPAIMERLGLKGKSGVRVTRVLDDRTPLRVGDVITAIDSQAVRVSSSSDDDVFPTEIRRYPIGSTVHLSVNRARADTVISVMLGTTRPAAREMKTYQDAVFDFRARNVAEPDRDDPRFGTSSDGAMVESVTEGGWAELAHLQAGDVILTVDSHRIRNVDDLAAEMKRAADTHAPSVVLEIRRGVRTLFLEVQPTWK